MIGTTEKILNNLQKMSTDKKGLLTKRYDDNSAWMEAELRKIHALLGKPLPEIKSSSFDPEVEKVSVVEVSEDNYRQKRKSPEVAINSTRFSPDQKRVSTDYAQLALDAGLPADLNRLKKEQLLSELQARGDETFTLKSLKKELVDALKDLLAVEDMKAKLGDGVNMTEGEHADTDAAEEQSEELEQQEQQEQPVEEEIEQQEDMAIADKEEEEVVEIAAEPEKEAEPEPVEEEVAEPEQVSEPEQTSHAEECVPVSMTSKDPQQALQERMARHRHSQARKSGVGGNLAAEEPAGEAVATPAATEVPAAPEPQLASEADSVANSVCNSPMKDNAMWTDVHSPMVESKVAPVEEEKPAAPVVAAVSAPMKASSQIASGTLTSFSVASKAAAINNASKSITQPVQNGLLKKPSNLVAGSTTTSFIPAHTAAAPTEKPKPLVPALAQAAKLREQEEARALQKKQALLQHQQAKSSGTGSVTTASIISKTNMTLNNNKTAAAAAAAAAPVHTSAKARLHPPPVLSTASNEAKKLLQSAAPAVPTTPADKGEKPATTATTTPGGGVAQIFGFLNPFKGATGTPSSTVKAGTTTPGAKPVAPAVATSTTTIPLPPKPITPVQPQQKMAAPQQQAHPIGSPERVVIKPKMATPKDEPQYEMDDMLSSDEEDSGTEDEDEQKAQKFIPEWARNVALKEALGRQFGTIPGYAPVDPDNIFDEVQTCNLEEIFGGTGGKYGKYSRRTSSAKWDADELTLIEKRKYRNVMGYYNGNVGNPSTATHLGQQQL